LNLWRALVAVLLGAAAIGAIFRSANASTVGRYGGLLAAVALGAVAVGVFRARRWADGSAFFLGLFWLWAAVALRIQGVMDAPEIFVWLVWSIAVMVGSVRVRVA
jgi:hypothetical protein